MLRGAEGGMASVCAKEKIAPRDQRGRKEAIFHANYYITAQALVGYLSRFPYLGTLLPEGLTFWPHLHCAACRRRRDIPRALVCNAVIIPQIFFHLASLDVPDRNTRRHRNRLADLSGNDMSFLSCRTEKRFYSETLNYVATLSSQASLVKTDPACSRQKAPVFLFGTAGTVLPADSCNPLRLSGRAEF